MSDTHDNAPNVRRIVELLNQARVERVIHTGDITRPATLELLGGLEAPLFGVFGNNDVDRAGLDEAARTQGFQFGESPLRLEWHRRRLAVVHDPEAHPELLGGGLDVLVHGHHHRRVNERRGDTLVFNPGECAGMLRGRNAVGVLDLEKLDAEVLLF